MIYYVIITPTKKKMSLVLWKKIKITCVFCQKSAKVAWAKGGASGDGL
jgi:hypothetical protein